MKLFGLELGWAQKDASLTIDQLITRLEAVYETAAGIAVSPDTALQSSTVQAVVRTIGGRLATLPIHVMQKTTSKGRETKEKLPNHPVQRLLDAPNDYQTKVEFWLDGASWLLRYGNFYGFKARGVTGPVRRLEALKPSVVEPEQLNDLRIQYRVNTVTGQKVYQADQMLHARLASSDGVCGDSPVMMGRQAIALEIAAEKFGASFFGNGAVPALIFQYAANFTGHRNDSDRTKFVEDLQAAFTGRGRFRGMLLPKGIEMPRDPMALDNNKAQFLETRKYQRTVIAGFFGVPPQFVGDLDRATFNNAEQQSIDFVGNVMLPIVRIFEAALEESLLTPEDRAGGVIIRFNIDGALRGDFLTRQQGLKIQREAGVVSPNDWREQEGMNPRTDPGGDEYWDQGPSGQNSGAAGNNGDKAPALSGANGGSRNGN